MTVAMHAERTADAEIVRWVISDRLLVPGGPVWMGRDGALRPGPDRHPLGERLLARVPEIAAVEIDRRHVSVRKCPDVDWTVAAVAVQRALGEALEEDGLFLAASTGPEAGSTLEQATALIEAAVGARVTSHGGRIEVTGLREGRITVRLLGACDGCPGARTTLTRALTDDLRARFPGLREVRIAGTADQ